MADDRSEGMSASDMIDPYGPQRQREEKVSQLVVVTFEDTAVATDMLDALENLAKQDLLNLEDAVVVSKNAEGKLDVVQTKHREKRTGTSRGAILGVMVGTIFGGPLVGLLGGTLIGRYVGKKMDLGVDDNLVESVANDLKEGNSALFLLGSAPHRAPLRAVFEQFHGTIYESTLDEDAREQLQKALDSES